MTFIQIEYINRADLINKELSIDEWGYETSESLQSKLETLNTLLDLFEVLKLDIIDMIRIKKENL